MESDNLKQRLGARAIDDFVQSGMRVGLGTGSTAIWAVKRLSEKLRGGELESVVCVVTSSQTELECETLGIPIYSLNHAFIGGMLDVTIDGADEIEPSGCLCKGGGGALALEKVVAYNSKRVVIVAEERKYVAELGKTFPIAVEVLREARLTVTRTLEAMGAQVQLRMAERKMGPVITDNGHLLLDITIPHAFDSTALERELNAVPGVVENGLFGGGRFTVYLMKSDGSLRVLE